MKDSMKKIPTKEEYLKSLRSNQDYLEILKASPKEDRKQIINTVEHVATKLLEALTFMSAQVKQDPKIAQEIVEALKTGDGIIKESDGAPIVSKPTPEEK